MSPDITHPSPCGCHLFSFKEGFLPPSVAKATVRGPILPQCGVIPLLGEMSRSDKRVPVSGGKMSASQTKGDGRVTVPERAEGAE